ncbi:MAG TPA: DUF5317 domain-containing protein [Acidimicrobiia bacterium]
MGSIAVAGGVAIAIVLVTRGSLRQLLRLKIQAIWMVVLALGIQIVLEFVDLPKDRIDDLGFGLLMASYGLLLAFCFVNLRIPAMWIVGLGVALNTLVIGLNQGMPTRDREVTTAAGRIVERPIERTVKHRPESDDDLLPFLGDQIVIPGPIDEVISVGDIVLGIGIVSVCYFGSRRRVPRAVRTARLREQAQRNELGRRARSGRTRRRTTKPPPATSGETVNDPLWGELEPAATRMSSEDGPREPAAHAEADEDERDDPLSERDR